MDKYLILINEKKEEINKINEKKNKLLLDLKIAEDAIKEITDDIEFFSHEGTPPQRFYYENMAYKKYIEEKVSKYLKLASRISLAILMIPIAYTVLKLPQPELLAAPILLSLAACNGVVVGSYYKETCKRRKQQAEEKKLYYKEGVKRYGERGLKKLERLRGGHRDYIDFRLEEHNKTR